MAVAIPLIMGATGASAAIGAAVGLSATAVSMGTGLLLGATGINAKIDKAASKVFGKDLVKLGNIAGLVYGAAGGFGGASPSEVFGNLGFGGAAAAQGALPAAGGNPFDAGSLSSAGGFEGGFQAPPSVLDGALASNVQAAATMNPSMPTAMQPPGATAPKAAGLTQIWNGMGDKGQAALIQMGGNLLSGMAAGKAEEENNERYRSGSGRAWGGGALSPNRYMVGGGR